MRRTASEVLSDLEIRVARLERQAGSFISSRDVPTTVRKIEEILDSVARKTRIKSDRFKLALREVEKINDGALRAVAREYNIKMYSRRTPIAHTVVRHFMLEGGYVTLMDVDDPILITPKGPFNDWSDDVGDPDYWD